MIDTRLHTLLTLMEAGSYTKAARVLSLTQPLATISGSLSRNTARRFFTGARNSLN